MDTDECEAALIALPRFDLPAALGQASVGGGVMRGVPARRVTGRPSTVFDILLAQYAGLPWWPTDYTDASTPGTPAWQEEFTSAAIKIGCEFAANAVETQGRSMIRGCRHEPLLPLRRDVPHLPGTDGKCVAPSRNGGWPTYVGQEKVRLDHGRGSFTPLLTGRARRAR